ncbi:MAG TPA: TolC family protein [Candidatus Acidoferrales bacterium]|nr:TolC family protein [Candidatus Acidoferrales bacterium]
MKIASLITPCAAVAAFALSMSAAFAGATPTPTPNPTQAPTPMPVGSAPPNVMATARPANYPPPAKTVPPLGGEMHAAVPAELSLSQAEDIALASSPELVIARAVVDQNNAGIGIARSGELPNISANASYGRAKQNFRISGGSTVPFLATQNTGSVDLRQLILDGGRVNALVQAARYSTESAKLTLLRSIQTVLLTVAQQYYAALQGRHQLAAAQSSLNYAKVQERLVEAQFHAGVASKADVLTAQLPVAQAEVTVASAQSSEAQNVAALLTTMGVPANTPVTLKDDTAINSTRAKVEDVLSSALQQRPDLSAARASVWQAQANVRAAKLQAFPNISGTASSGTASTATNGTKYAPNWSLGASLSFPLYSGGLIRSQADQARAFQQQAEASYRLTELNVYLNVQQAYLQLVTAASSLNAALVAQDQARVLLNVTNAQYKSGVTTLPLLLNAQTQLTTAQSNYVQALYAYKVAQQNLLYAEGTIAPM